MRIDNFEKGTEMFRLNQYFWALQKELLNGGQDHLYSGKLWEEMSPKWEQFKKDFPDEKEFVSQLTSALLNETERRAIFNKENQGISTFGKDSKEYLLYLDFWNLQKKYYNGDKNNEFTEEFIEQMLDDVLSLPKRHPDLKQFSKDISWALIYAIDRRCIEK